MWPRDDRAEQLRAGRIVQRLETAGQGVHQAVVRRFECDVAIYFCVTDEVGDVCEFLVPVGTLRGANTGMWRLGADYNLLAVF